MNEAVRITENDKTNWERRLAGEIVEVTTAGPDYGFYRLKTRDGLRWQRAMYHYYNGVLVCLIDGHPIDEARALELWPHASENAITYELYRAVGNGDPWPDHAEAVTRLHNNPPEETSFEYLRDSIADLVRDAKARIAKGAAQTRDAMDQAANVVNALSGLWKKADDARKVEKAPYLTKCREIDDTWGELTDDAKIYELLNKFVVLPYLAKEKREKEKREAEARRIAEEAAERARRELEEAARKAEEATRAGTEAKAEVEAQKARAREAAEEAAQAAQAAQVIATTTVTAGTQGRRRVHLRAKKIVTITDWAKVREFFEARLEEAIPGLLQEWSEKAVKAGMTVPGTMVTEEDTAV